MATDVTDMLRAQLRNAAQEAARNLADSSTEKKSKPLSGIKGIIIGAGIALTAKMAIDAARKGSPRFVTDLSERINATLAEVRGDSEEETDARVDQEPDAELEDEEAEFDEEEPEAELDEEEEPEAELDEEEPEAELEDE